MKKVGIATVHTGYNYGSALQAYATKVILRKLNYQGVILALKGSLINGRDVRLKKIVVIFLRLLRHPSNFTKHIKRYETSVAHELSKISTEQFECFTKNYLKPIFLSWKDLKRLGKTDDIVAFVCGSDQIWNADTLYVDPFYYLRFTNRKKRIAFAPSFGRENIPQYNRKIIKKYINGIDILSVREKTGVNIIKELCGKKAVWLLDPSLLLSSNEWRTCLTLEQTDIVMKGDYILAYFLDEPSEYAKKWIKNLKEQMGLPIIELPYIRKLDKWFDQCVDAGPKEFIYYISHATYVVTDSFHGTAFAINFEIPFFVFQRQYGIAGNQSSRISSLLELTGFIQRFNPDKSIMNQKIDFQYARNVLEQERTKAEFYLQNALYCASGKRSIGL